MYCEFHYSVFMGFWIIKRKGSLHLHLLIAPSLFLLLVVLTNSVLLIFLLSYYIVLLSYRSLLFSFIYFFVLNLVFFFFLKNLFTLHPDCYLPFWSPLQQSFPLSPLSFSSKRVEAHQVSAEIGKFSFTELRQGTPARRTFSTDRQ